MIKNSIKRLLSNYGYSLTRNQTGQEQMYPHRDFMKDKRDLLGKKKLCILDAGAYIGEMALGYRQSFPEARIIALEPFPETFEILKKKTHNHNIECYPFALAEKTGAAQLQLFKHAPANSMLQPHSNRESVWGEGVLEANGILPIQTVSLIDAFHDFGIQHLDLLKLDVQGMEFKILNGAKKLLQNGAVDYVYLELILMPTYEQQEPFSQYLTLMEETGFELHNLYNLSSIHGQLRQVDALFKRKKTV